MVDTHEVLLDRTVTPLMEKISQRFGGMPIEQLIVSRYKKHEKARDPHSSVADDLGVSRFTLYVWCKRLGIRVITRRGPEQATA